MPLQRQAFTSAVHSDSTLEALRQIVPSVFTEVRGADGKLTHKVDFEALRELLGDDVLDTDEDRFGFYWVGKQEAKRVAAEPTRSTLRPIVEDSVDWENTQNLYIEGDNLEVLKLLQRAYIGKVKMIYIDPPYNTGNDFVYQDDFAMTPAEEDEAMGNIDEMGNRMRSNPKTAQRYHSDWCSMMYSRLLVARTLLANDGVIFISIDDNEVHHLRKICDEVFGASNFVATFPWRKRTAKSDVPFGISQDYEWILVFAKSGNFRASTQGKPRRYYTTEDYPNRPWRIHDLTKQTSASERPNSFFTIINPKTGEQYPCSPNRTWAITEETFTKYHQDGRIVFPGDYDFLSNSKPVLRYWEEDDRAKAGELFGQVAVSTSLGNVVGMSQDGTKEITSLFERKVFPFPKPVNLIKHLLEIISTPDSLILDFFSGSATTAHAVMQLNAEDGGRRKYICVQLPEPTPEKSEARKAGYANICEIGKERIRRAGKQILETNNSELTTSLDTGFRVLRLDSSNMQDVYFEPVALSQEDLFSQVDSVKPDRTELDLFFGCMIDWGIAPSVPLRTEVVAGKTLLIANEGELVACFDKDIASDTIRYIAQMKPERVIFRETCFATDHSKLNIYENFKQFCQWSDNEVYKRIHVV